MLTSSLIVVLLKHLAARHCPWDLVEYGGPLTEMNQWFTVPWLASHCFPSGHAAGGFSLVAVYFAGRRLGQTALARGGLIAGLTFGVVFRAVRVAQGRTFSATTFGRPRSCG